MAHDLSLGTRRPSQSYLQGRHANPPSGLSSRSWVNLVKFLRRGSPGHPCPGASCCTEHSHFPSDRSPLIEQQMAELPSVANLTSETMSVAYPLLRGQARFCGRTQGLSVGSLGRHPRGFRLQAGLRPTKPRPETATRAGRRCPVGALFRSREESTAGTTREEIFGPKVGRQ